MFRSTIRRSKSLTSYFFPQATSFEEVNNSACDHQPQQFSTKNLYYSSYYSNSKELKVQISINDYVIFLKQISKTRQKFSKKFLYQ